MAPGRKDGYEIGYHTVEVAVLQQFGSSSYDSMESFATVWRWGSF